MARDDKFTMTVKKKRETNSAYLFQDLGTGEEVWIPRSCVIEMDISGGDGDETYDVVITKWIAEQKGLC